MHDILFPHSALLKCTRFFKMGGPKGGGTTTVQSSAPPPTNQSVEVQEAQREARRQAAKRKGMTTTVLAGETGGYQPMGATGAKPTVLGGV